MSDILLVHAPADTLTYPIEKARYHCDSDDRLWLSLECAPPRDHAELPGFQFCLLRYPLENEPVAGKVLWLPYAQGERSSFDQSSSHACDSVHYDPWSLRIDILVVERGVLRTSGMFLLEGELTAAGFRPGDRHVSFKADFRAASLEDIWNPGF